MSNDKKLAFIYIARVRSSLRLLARRRSALHDERRSLERKARQLKDQGNPFAASRIKTMEATARDLADRARTVSDDIHGFGKLLADAAPMIDACTTLDERCCALNVNVADRSGLTEADGVVNIVFLHGLEDSAERRHAQWNDGPLFNGLHLVFADFLRTPEGQRVGNSLFEPGGLFEDVPTYTMNADGTMKRNPPRLRAVTTGALANDEDA